MKNMVENLTGMKQMTAQVIAGDLLITAKTGIKNYALALTETATPEVRTILRDQLNEAIDSHEQIIQYMMDRKFYLPYDINGQLQLDLQNAETALNTANQAGQQQQQ